MMIYGKEEAKGKDQIVKTNTSVEMETSVALYSTVRAIDRTS